MGDLLKPGPKDEAHALGLLQRRGHELLERNFRRRAASTWSG